MGVLKKILTSITALIIILVILVGNSKKVISVTKDSSARQLVNVALIAKDLANDDYLIYICEDFKEIEKKNQGKVKFTCYDSKSNLAIENEIIDRVVKEGVDLILLDATDTKYLQETINKIKIYNIPVIVFNREPLTMEPIKSYAKALYIGTDSKQSGIMQGKILIDAWNANKDLIDRNKDDIMQYIMLQGERHNRVPLERTKYSILTIEEAGIKTEELALVVGQWDLELAKNEIKSLLLRYGNKIEVIIANDDTMALGAIEALQEFGYNNGDKTKTIPVVGVDGVPKARELIEEGIMLGSVVHDPMDLVQALYSVGMNLVNNKNPIEGTEYKLDDTGVAIYIPFRGYIDNINGYVEDKEYTIK
ncbi:galactose ABC transporter substrate-binding protein [Clostridium weizhouense]|uniref:D-galactose/methyl-galactoside binding periplasmic protein MglB n=1 Tax=Clostridium weizhouense TaxID=2859781 RepID=A0ABS7ANY8_9CLOT|nr:galactose ABC transporter substrate-binding protein [Clostridium weizhouense]MBW6410126.1 galactose ABC transporter substrate-binding protein [Clostridium weizhouense]